MVAADRVAVDTGIAGKAAEDKVVVDWAAGNNHSHNQESLAGTSVVVGFVGNNHLHNSVCQAGTEQGMVPGNNTAVEAPRTQRSQDAQY